MKDEILKNLFDIRKSASRDDDVSGAWIFVSHSHKDLLKVRKVRNELEIRGHDPILFFLKCLKDDDPELPDLIRREIKARDWFVLCDSQNARQSYYVQEEIKVIKSMKGKIYEVIDLMKDIEKQLQKFDRLSKRATVFISYAHADVEIARHIANRFREHDYRVFIDIEDIKPGDDWSSIISRTIDEAVENGYFLLLMSQNAFLSKFWQYKNLYALNKVQSSRVSNIIPIIIRDKNEVLSQLSKYPGLSEIQYFDLTIGSLDDRISQLIANLKTREME